jgi:hypothetical protein
MRYQVSDESEVGLKCLPLVEKPIPGRGARPFLYRSREGPGYKREREKKKKEKKTDGEGPGCRAALLFSRGALVL